MSSLFIVKSNRDQQNFSRQKSLLVANRPFAYRYLLKKAIFDLGPTGFPFEQLIGRVSQSSVIIKLKRIK